MKNYPIYYVGWKLATLEKNYYAIDWDTLEMSYSIRKFRHYLLDYLFILHVDHFNLKYLENKPNLSSKN